MVLNMLPNNCSEKSSPRMGHFPPVCFPALLCQASPSAGGTKRITGGGVLMVDHEEEDLRTEYERQRAAHVARNREYMARLGVLSAVAAVQPKPKPNNNKMNQAKVKVKVEGEVERRRSGRLRGAKVEYTMEDLKDDVEDGARKRRRREGGACRRQNDDDEAGERRRREEEAMRAWLAESREAMISRRVEPEDAGGWRAEAVRRWGEGVAAAEAGTGAVCWETFVRTRLSRPPPPSPHALLQEFYAHDPWRLLSCCVLMSRVSSWETKHFCIAEFFKAFPTPSDFSPQGELRFALPPEQD